MSKKRRYSPEHFHNPYHVAMTYGCMAAAAWHCWYELRDTDPVKADEYRETYLKERDDNCDFWDGFPTNDSD